VTGAWTAPRALSATRYGHRAALLPDGEVLLTGGIENGTTAERYDPAQQRWTVTARINEGRAGHTATVLRNGNVLIAGGLDFDLGIFRSSAELYSDETTVSLRATRLPSGIVRFELASRPGANVNVYASTDVSVPSSQWTPLGAATEVSPGSFRFEDPLSAILSHRYFQGRVE